MTFKGPAVLLAIFAAAILGLPAAAEIQVRSAEIKDAKTVFATVESADLTAARARIGGTIAELAVDDGDTVQAGARIAIVGDPKLHLQIQAADQRVRSLQAQAELARLEVERARELFRRGTATRARLDDAETGLAVASRGLAAAQAERQVVVERASEGAVIAAVSGRVLEVHVTDGSVVMPGEAVATIASGDYVLRLHLPERHARFIGIGDMVEVGAASLAAEGQTPLRMGIVRKVYPTIRDGRVVADVQVEGMGDFFVGERVQVQVTTGTRTAFVVPEDYVFRRFGVDFVRLKDGPDLVVRVGRPVEGGVEILAGLRDGDVLVTP